MQRPDWDDPAARLAWLRDLIPSLIRQEGRPITLSKLTYTINCISNPRRYKKKGEYHFPHEEVERALELLIADYELSGEQTRNKYDPKDGRRRYWLPNVLEAMAQASAEGDAEDIEVLESEQPESD